MLEYTFCGLVVCNKCKVFASLNASNAPHIATAFYTSERVDFKDTMYQTSCYGYHNNTRDFHREREDAPVIMKQ